MKKSVKVVLIIAAIIVCLVVAGIILGPRVFFCLMSNKMNAPDVIASDFTDYDITAEGANVGNGAISIVIDPSYTIDVEKSTKMESTVYRKDNCSIVFMPPYDFGDTMNLVNGSLNQANGSLFGISGDDVLYSVNQWGYATPDNAYNTQKLIHQIKKDDYSFWSLKKARAYSILKVMQASLLLDYEQTYYYEKDDIKGFISVNQNASKSAKFKALLEIYTEDNLNVANNIIIVSDSLEEIYAIMNSAEKATE